MSPQKSLSPASSPKTACLSLQLSVQDDAAARDSTLESCKAVQNLGLTASSGETGRRPSSWDPLARYHSEAHSFPDYGVGTTASNKMRSKTRLKELNGRAAGGLNTLTNPPPPLIATFSPRESPPSKRHKPNDPNDDSTHSRYFPTPDRHRANETHDLTLSDSQEDPYDFRSNSSTGKSKITRVSVGEFRSAQPPRSHAVKSRTRRSRSSFGNHKLLDASRKSSNIDFDSENHFGNSESWVASDVPGQHNPPPSNIHSDIVHTGPKRQRATFHTETSSPHFKRPRLQQSVESIESEDELSKDHYGDKRFSKFADPTSSKPTSNTRGDIQHTQFLKPAPIPSYVTAFAGPRHVHVKRAVSGKNMFAGTGNECELVLRQGNHSTILSPKCSRDTESPLDWLAIDLDKVIKIEHSAREAHVVHVMRPRSHSFESSLWLELMDHRDVMALAQGANIEQLAHVGANALEKKWNQAWNNAKHYCSVNANRPSASLPSTQQDGPEEVVTQKRQSDKDSSATEPRRTAKLVDQMRGPPTNDRGPSVDDLGEKVSVAAKTPVTRRTRRSSPAHIHQEASPERWTDQTPDWRDRWYQSLVFPATGKNRATVDDGDILRLDEGEFLNDNLISFYIRYLQFKLESEKPELFRKVYFFSTFFFEKLRSTRGKINYEGVKAWTAKFDLLSYDYIVVPVNEHAHWYLAVICNAPNAVNGIPQQGDDKDSHEEHVEDSSTRIAAIERDMSDVTIMDVDAKPQSANVETPPSSLPTSAKTMQNLSPPSKTTSPAGPQTSAAAPRHDDPRAPKIITLDSLANAHPTTCRVLREYLVAEAKDKKGVELVHVPNGMTAKRIPEQNNFCDCGVFVLGYMEEFLKDPDGTVRKLLQREPLGWDIRPSQLRNSLRDLLFKMQREQHERLMKEKEQKRLLSAKKKALIAKDADVSIGGASANMPSTPGKQSSPAKLPGACRAVSPARTLPGVVDMAEDDGIIRSTRTDTVARPPAEQLSQDDAAFLKSPRGVVTNTDSKGDVGNSHGLGPSLRNHESVQGRLTVSGTRGHTATPSAMTPDTSKVLVKTLPISSSEAEMQENQTVPEVLKHASMGSRDVEEVMSISGSRRTRQTSKQLESPPSLVQVLRSSESPSLPSKLPVKYDGIERRVDLT